jgi:hypothetical protein
MNKQWRVLVPLEGRDAAWQEEGFSMRSIANRGRLGSLHFLGTGVFQLFSEGSKVSKRLSFTPEGGARCNTSLQPVPSLGTGRSVFVATLAVLWLLLGARPASPDDIYARIQGTVTDPTGAVVPGATVTATNPATGITKVAVSASDGTFEFLQLSAPAAYSVRAEAKGFKSFQATDITLGLDQIYVLNVAMEVGALTESVTVEASPSQVETTGMQLGRTLTSNAIVDLPLNGRNWVQLQQTLPGVVASDRFPDNYATNGSRSQTNNFMVNGTDANDLPVNTPLIVPSPDAIAEVSMITNTINPEYGRNGGAILNATTKSGSNQFHGDGFEFYRDTALNTRNFFSPTATVYHQNQFGGTVGGPIKKDKAFFFFSYQGTRYRRPETVGDCGGCTPGTSSVFTPAQRSGDFSSSGPFGNNRSGFSLTGSNGAVYPAGTPYNVIFPDSKIPVSNFNPVAFNLLNKYVPLPTVGSLYEFNAVANASFNQYLGRVDYNATSKDAVWGYFFIEPVQFTQALPFFGADLPGFAEQDPQRAQQYTLDWTHTFNGTMLNELRLGYNRLNYHAIQPVTPVLPSSAGFTGINPQYPAGASVPEISLAGYFSLGFSTDGPQPRIDQTYQVTDNFSKIVGHHTLKFGFDMRRSQVWNPFYGSNNGAFTFNGGGTYSTGNPAADFLLGIPDAYAQTNGGVIDSRTQTYYSYGQDQWKVRPNLTLTFGAGWQIDTPLTEKYAGGEAINCFVPGQQSKMFATAPVGLNFPGDPGCNSAGGPTTRLAHIAPRGGFAWSPDASRKWSLRGGFGVYYDRTEEEPLLQTLTPPPFSITSGGAADVGGSPAFATPFVDVHTGQAINNPFPFAPPPPGAKVDFTKFPPLFLFVFDKNLSVPYTLNYNLTLERELPGSMILSVGYVGLQGRKLTSLYELNPAGGAAGNPVCGADPNCNSFNIFATHPETFRYPQTFIPSGSTTPLLQFGGIDQYGTFVNSNYNALQVTLDKKLTHGSTFRVAYAWSHSLDGSSSFEDLSFSGFRGLDPFNFRNNYGDSAFDARQRLVVSYTYDLPSARRFNAFRAIPSRLTDGWRIAGVTTFQTGVPVTVGSSAFLSGTCDFNFEFSCWDRPNTVKPVATYNPRTSSANNSLDGTISPLGTQSHYWFDPNAFANAPVGVQGNAGRNFFHGPGINNFDFSLMKDTRITEGTRLELRFEFFNFFNHAQFSLNGVRADANGANFGQILSARTPNDSRIVQLAAKFYF